MEACVFCKCVSLKPDGPRVFAQRAEVTAGTGEAGTLYWFGFIALGC